jgi:4-hydroxy-2-oxoheptanedioate aldolase
MRPIIGIRQKLREGKAVSVVSGHWTADMIEYMGQFGLDGIWIECEHGPTDWEQIGDFSRAADLWGMASIVRVGANDPSLIMRTLDRGASGIVVPHVSTREAAERVVQAVKFGPIGQRGIFGGRRSYGVDNPYQQANDETLVVILIEEAEALENLDAILAVEHVDVFQVASADLAQSLGHTGDAGHPEVQAAVEGALRQIVAAGRTAGMAIGGGDPNRFLDLGVRFIYTSWNRWAGAGAKALSDTIAARNVATER